MQKLLSLPPNLVESFYKIEEADPSEWFVTSDPIGEKLGSGGGTTWLMRQWNLHHPDDSGRRRIILHAGGQSRRLPAYASSGKILTPVPVFRWERGQRITQNLLSLQLPLYERIMAEAPEGLTTLIASGDVYIRAEEPLQEIPDVDVVCYGLWVDPVLATHHGVFVARQTTPDVMEYMLQKPSLDELEKLASDHYFLMDIGIWLLSDKAMEKLARRSQAEGAEATAERPWNDICNYDLYSDFGGALGANPRVADDEVNSLSVAILPLPGGEFYHYGTSAELLSSTARVQNKVYDQRLLMQRRVRPNSSLFVQNTDIGYHLTKANESVWVENAHVPASWILTERNIVTGVPRNNWSFRLDAGVCLDIEPVKQGGHVVRPYGFDDPFRGDIANESTIYLGRPFAKWLCDRGLTAADFSGPTSDLQALRLFPVVTTTDDMEAVARWMTYEPENARGREVWMSAQRLSADEISACADLEALFAQRREFCRDSLEKLSANHENSIFYQLDLDDLARQFNRMELAPPAPLNEYSTIDRRLHNHMLRSRIYSLSGDTARADSDERSAFELLRNELLGEARKEPQFPKLNVYADQIVWGRSPVRIDLAGGWTDTPPYSLLNGGRVVNMAIELNGQQPLHVYVKPSEKFEIVLRSIDMSAIEVVSSYNELQAYNKVGSPFSIPKAALSLAGFSPDFSGRRYNTLREQLEDFGCGIEVTLLSAIPAGSGLGTSSILASTVLGTLSDFCGLGWDDNEICSRTLALEQLLTTGGGWQDQYGGVLQGVKLLETVAGSIQQPVTSWLPEYLFTAPGYRDCHLLYYTGMTRVAKNILSEIVRGMFLNSSRHLELLGRMKEHAIEMTDAIHRNDFDRYGKMVLKTWEQNKALDAGTNPPMVEKIIASIADYCVGYKLPGAGGGGFLYMVAKDREAALRIRAELRNHAPNSLARFVDFKLSNTGFHVSRS